MPTLLEMETKVRDVLDEPVAAQWSQGQLRSWMNDGNKELARVTRFYKDRKSVVLVAGTAEYILPTDVLAVEHGYYVDTVSGSGSRHVPLMARHWEDMDVLWSEYQGVQGLPQVFTVWGYAPTLAIRFYPVPSISGDTASLNVATYPTDMPLTGDDATTADIPTGWEDAVVEYAVYMAKRKDRDPTWQEAWAAFAGKRDELMQTADYLAVNRMLVPDPVLTGGVPWWVAEFD